MAKETWTGVILNFSGIMFKQNQILFIGYSKRTKKA
jgi:hypothetical protein